MPLLALLGLLTPRSAHADDLDDIRQRGELRWGGDQEGGGPYVFPREDDAREVTGFEVELAQAIARNLGVRPVFVQGPWDRLPDLLRIRKIHIILNGYELTAAHQANMAATAPYQAYGLQLLGRRGEAPAGWDELRRAGVRVGALTGSAAEGYLKQFCQQTCRVVSYDGSTDAMREVETRKLDATLQDTPIASFYAARFPALAPLGAPVAPGQYVMYARQGQTRLVAALDEALRALWASGEIERIDRRYGLWTPAQIALAGAHGATAVAAGSSASAGPASRSSGEAAVASAAASAVASPGEAPGSEPVVRLGERKRGLAAVGRSYGGVLLSAAGLTVALALLAFPLAALLGLLLALGRLYGPRPLSMVLGAWVEFLRGTPLMLQLYFAFFVLPEVGLALPAFATGVLGLAVNYSAYEAEIYRAGLQAVPTGQLEAALVLGLTRAQALRRVVIPQALRLVIPPMVNDFIALFKDTSVCSVITLVELTKRFSVLSQSTQATIELMALTAALYLAMSYPLAALSRRLERRLTPQEVPS